MRSADGVVDIGFQNPSQRLWGTIASILIFFYTVVLGLLAIFGVLIIRKGWVVDVLGKIWCRLIVWTCGIEIEVRGLENIKPNECYVLLSNHLSNFDIWCTFAALPVKIRFVAKKELLRLPIFGQALLLSDHIIIDRSKPEQAVEIINRQAAQRIGEGFCILFYAEGTRSPDGKVHAFKKGAVALALRTGLPVVPLSISGTRKFLPKRSVIIRPGGRVCIVLDKAIATAGIPFDARDELNDRVREIVIKNYVEDL